ncbi:MAG: hypothetical protein HGN29_16575 [Asgard group archaeon]|nr:hypothetical protein [Asgard group archaeon]
MILLNEYGRNYDEFYKWVKVGKKEFRFIGESAAKNFVFKEGGMVEYGGKQLRMGIYSFQGLTDKKIEPSRAWMLPNNNNLLMKYLQKIEEELLHTLVKTVADEKYMKIYEWLVKNWRSFGGE